MIIPASAKLAYDVTIKDENQSYVVKTSRDEAMDILGDYNVKIGTKDKVILDDFESRKGGTIVIDRYNDIYIKKDDDVRLYSVYANNIKDALNELNITVADDEYQLNCNYDDYIEKGMVIEFQKLYSVEIHADGNSVKCKTVSATISDVLKKQNIVIEKDDYTEPSLDKIISKDMDITVHRVEYKTETKTESIKYSTTKKEDSTLNKGKTKVETEGVNGEEEVTYLVKYVDGTKKSSEIQSRKTTKAPVNKVLIVGTKKVKNNKITDVTSNGKESYNGLKLNETIKGKYTHYCACATCNGNGRGITSSGKKIYNGMSNPYYVACNWLPLGSVISVNGTNYTVVDRGGSGLSTIGRIDIFTPEGHAACYKKGTGGCNITILRFGW